MDRPTARRRPGRPADVEVRVSVCLTCGSYSQKTYPNFPLIVEAELLRPDANHAPAVEQYNADCDNHEHSLGREPIAFLNLPEGTDANGLSRDTDDEEVRELETVVCDDFVLQGSDNGHSGIQTVTEEELDDGV